MLREPSHHCGLLLWRIYELKSADSAVHRIDSHNHSHPLQQHSFNVSPSFYGFVVASRSRSTLFADAHTRSTFTKKPSVLFSIFLFFFSFYRVFLTLGYCEHARESQRLLHGHDLVLLFVACCSLSLNLTRESHTHLHRCYPSAQHFIRRATEFSDG